MNLYSMPRELTELEYRLGGRPSVEPSAGLRDRVLRAAESALSERSSSAGQRDGWAWAACAAAVLIAINLSMISASQSEYLLRSVSSPNQIGAEVQALRLLESQQQGTIR
jgi:hypothetical protein